MSDPNKTVFISYRRDVSKYLALAIFKELQHNGYDTFLDVEKIDSGRWQSIIFNQVAARTHFVLLITAGTLDRCGEPNDVLRQEIEQAINLGRNIVLLLADNFDFNSGQKFLSGKLSELPRFNAMNWYYDMFDECMTKLTTRFLKIPSQNPSLIPTPADESSQVQQIINEMTNQPDPTPEELTAEQFLSRAYKLIQKGDWDATIADYTNAIQLKPNFAAYMGRGIAYYLKGDYAAAIDNFTQVINLNPSFTVYISRGETYFIQQEFTNALSDFREANEIMPGSSVALADLALTQHALGNIKESHRLWKIAVGIDAHYKDLNWVKKELKWADELAEEAKKLIADL